MDNSWNWLTFFKIDCVFSTAGVMKAFKKREGFRLVAVQGRACHGGEVLGRLLPGGSIPAANAVNSECTGELWIGLVDLRPSRETATCAARASRPSSCEHGGRVRRPSGFFRLEVQPEPDG